MPRRVDRFLQPNRWWRWGHPFRGRGTCRASTFSAAADPLYRARRRPFVKRPRAGRPADWVNHALYDHQLGLAEPGFRAARSLSGLLARVADVTPRPGQWRQNWKALQAQAHAALADFAPDSPTPESPSAGAPRPDPDPTVRVYLWPR